MGEQMVFSTVSGSSPFKKDGEKPPDFGRGSLFVVTLVTDYRYQQHFLLTVFSGFDCVGTQPAEHVSRGHRCEFNLSATLAGWCEGIARCGRSFAFPLFQFKVLQ